MSIREPKNQGKVVDGDPYVTCAMTGFKCRYSETVIDWTGKRVWHKAALKGPNKDCRMPKFPTELKDITGGGFGERDLDNLTFVDAGDDITDD